MRLSHFTKIAALAAATVLTAAACGGAPADSGSAPPVAEAPTFEAGTTMARLAEAGTLRVGTKFDQPGFGLQGLDGVPTGFDVEIAKIIAAGLGIGPDGITYTEAPSAVREEVIETDQVDLVAATYTINDARKERITFAGPYYEAGQTLMVRSDDTAINGPDDLRAAGSRVCSVAGSTPSQEILNYVDQAQLTLFDVYTKCADALRTNQVDVVTTDNVILTGFVADSDGAFKLAGEAFTAEPYGIGITKGDVAFCEFINETLTAAAADGSYAEAWTSTAGEISGEPAPELPTIDECV
jgi:glutamate transport system substrate-binding protein